ncbi:site-specific integrase [Endobacterium cereale]|uniref:site-specific integrase n=1 Tax=Endobacterium cereale TaxID=2663029 RepID=UPI002B49C051|nr:site-specific integrase [Endobacterium cereale]MEB2843782.1 site-specific integrase [Endobacterium cereale]
MAHFKHTYELTVLFAPIHSPIPNIASSKLLDPRHIAWISFAVCNFIETLITQMQKASTNYLFDRNGTYYFRMVIPPDRRTQFKKREWLHSLKTKCLNQALVLLAGWTEHYKALLSSDYTATVEFTLPQLRSEARIRGMHYQDVDSMSDASVEDSVSIIGAGLEAYGRVVEPAPVTSVAIGGAITQPALTIRQALEQFEADSTDMWLDLSHRERQKKWNKYKEAVTDFENEMGKNLDVLKLKKTDVYAYRSKLLERVKPKPDASGQTAKPIKVDTVRKKIMWLRVIVRHAYELAEMKDSPFENLRPIKGIGDEVKREVITEDEAKAVRMKYAEVGTNDELVAIMAVIENTGAHAKEIALLDASDIHLDADIPHISIQPNDHRSFLKTDNRVRKVPVVGIALDALKRFPAGFPRYRKDNGGEAVSAAANKLMKPLAPNKTTYSYRHRMADLMKAKGVEDTVRDSIMGHGNDGKMSGYYGTEYPLEIKLEVLKKVLPPHAY